ncbi:MAG: glycosyltransferase family 4 protein [Acidobacteriota bacterium]|jgi:glycosyltransferase involved in cell wall biosynthesis|nr:MAG: glycosyl transferase family 1 [Acidobacteriota bacterium]
MSRRILVCEAQVPFIRGGAESLVRELVAQLRLHGYDADLVSVPFKWYPLEELFAHAAAWRLLDLSESSGRRIDRVIATKFPTYFVRHPDKVTWLVHQYRAAYELVDTAFSEFEHRSLDVAVRDRIIALDTEMLAESRALFTIAHTVSARLARYNGLSSEALYHPPRLASRLRSGPAGDYVLSVGRLESVKRVDLSIRALAAGPPDLRLIIAGTGTQREAFERLAADLGLSRRVQFLGEVDDETLLELYAEALAVIFPPFDEDLGYVTLEAFLARKPVVTTTDAGEPTRFVIDGVNGRVTEPQPEALGAALADLHGDRTRAARLGEAGYELARRITWSAAIERLVEGL